MPDLETSIREALRSRSDDVVVVATSLRTRRHRSFAPLLAAAAVLVLALGAALFVGHRGNESAPPAAGSTDFVGYTWRLVTVRDRTGTVQVPSSLNTDLSFAPNREVVASDSVNALSGPYRVNGRGYSVTDVTTTDVAFAGGDRDRLRIIAAVDACFYTPRGAVSEAHADVGARVSGDGLTLSVKGYTLTYLRVGPKKDDPAPSSTPPPSGALGIVGYRWNLGKFSDSQGTGSVGDRIAWISFPSATTIQGDDSANGFQGTLHISGNQFSVSDAAIGGVGGTGPDRLGAAVDAVLAGAPVTVSLDGTTLTLTAGGTSLTLVRAAAVTPESSVPSATSSS